MTHYILMGNNIRQSATDELQPITELQLAVLVRDGNKHVINVQEQIRALQHIEKNALAELKKNLPYFIGATFATHIRKSQNFTEIFYLILDIDNISTSDTMVHTIRDSIIKDERVLLCFTSPSGRGLKCVFKLQHPIRNSAAYSQFYKSFAYRFAAQYHIEEYVDYTTCDVTRVCFIAHDPGVYYNLNAAMLSTQANPDDFEHEDTPPPCPPHERPLTPDVYGEILKTLDPKNYVIKKPKNIYVPPELQLVHHLIEELLGQNNMIIKETRDINYGKKLVITHQQNTTEVNIYYGKNGFQIVKGNKAGMHAPLTEACVAIIMKALHQYVNQ